MKYKLEVIELQKVTKTAYIEADNKEQALGILAAYYYGCNSKEIIFTKEKEGVKHEQIITSCVRTSNENKD